VSRRAGSCPRGAAAARCPQEPAPVDERLGEEVVLREKYWYMVPSATPDASATSFIWICSNGRRLDSWRAASMIGPPGPLGLGQLARSSAVAVRARLTTGGGSPPVRRRGGQVRQETAFRPIGWPLNRGIVEQTEMAFYLRRPPTGRTTPWGCGRVGIVDTMIGFRTRTWQGSTTSSLVRPGPGVQGGLQVPGGVHVQGRSEKELTESQDRSR